MAVRSTCEFIEKIWNIKINNICHKTYSEGAEILGFWRLRVVGGGWVPLVQGKNIIDLKSGTSSGI